MADEWDNPEAAPKLVCSLQICIDLSSYKMEVYELRVGELGGKLI